MSFKHVFIAVVLATGAIAAALLINAMRPAEEVAQPTADLVAATGKCAECHRRETSAIVHQFEQSAHARSGVTCLDCHRPVEGQKARDHRGFRLSAELTAKNCAACHTTEYEQYERSRHAGPAWAAVSGTRDFSEAQLALSEKYHPKASDRPPNILAMLEGPAAIQSGCQGCHSVGKPNHDGSFGTCIECHSRHAASIELARQPATCGQCHVGPDHSQIEIFNESKHGVLFRAQKSRYNLAADPKKLTTKDIMSPTCSTCHMSGLEGLNVTHDTTERLSYFLFAPISKKRPGYAQGRSRMMEVCNKCHSTSHTKAYFERAEQVVEATNEKVAKAQAIVAGLRKDGLLTDKPFDEPIEFVEFDFWHYFGRTAKHGAFMGGADFVQWHGNYELLHLQDELQTMADEIRRKAANAKDTSESG